MVFETIRALLSEQLGFDESDITLRTSMYEELQAQEADLQEILILLEQEFEIEWTEDDLKHIETVADLTAFVENQI